MRDAFAAYDDPTQLALARREALVAAATATIAWARRQASARPPRKAASMPVARTAAAAAPSVSPLADAARSASGAGLNAVRGARSAIHAFVKGLTAAAANVSRIGVPILRALPVMAVVAAVAGGLWFGLPKARPYFERWKDTAPIERSVPAMTEADLQPSEPVAASPAAGSKKRTGRLVVTSANAVTQVLVDGKARGVTPLTLDGLSAGSHTVTLQSMKGSVTQTVAVKAGETAQFDQTIFPGWVALVAPIDLMLSPGPHELLLTNRALGYQETRHVDVRPGETTQLSIAPPRSKATFTATAPAEVWVDGKSVGQTPLIDLPVEIGTHHVKMKSGSAERQFTVTTTMTPFAFNA